MKNLKETLIEYGDVALGHFNVSDSTQFNAIVEAANELEVSVVIGLSEGEKKFIGIDNIVAMVQNESRVFLNLDHSRNVQDCKEAIDKGFDSVMIDGSKLDFDENVAITKEVADYAKNVFEKTGRKTLVEGELGYIGASSKILNDIPEGAGLERTTPEQAAEFVHKTGVDMLAPSVGNLHGMLKGRANNPDIDIDLIKKIKQALLETFLVLHGGSGIKDEDFVSAINSGINVVHINTEIRKAYREGIENALLKDKEEIAPYRYLNEGKLNVKEIVKNRIKLFMNL